ncbi:hypothetical protein ES705_36283 [subsurface metagenome]
MSLPGLNTCPGGAVSFVASLGLKGAVSRAAPSQAINWERSCHKTKALAAVDTTRARQEIDDKPIYIHKQ